MRAAGAALATLAAVAFIERMVGYTALAMTTAIPLLSFLFSLGPKGQVRRKL
jgi:hypothetical protein